jgi:hypothetical protein
VISRRFSRAVLLGALSWLLPACGSWVSVSQVATAQKKPNNAWVFLSVERGDAPLTGLTADDFTIYEDGNPVTKADSRQLLQSPDVAAVMYTLLLVDLSGTSTAAAPDAMIDAAKAFVERVGKTQKVAVYGFDGEERIHSLVPFSDAQAAPANAFDALRKYRTKDPSTNLHGAVVEGLRELRRALDRERRPLRFGALVVLAQGIDRANRVSRDTMRTEMEDDKYRLYQVLAVGQGADRSYADDVGKDGLEGAADASGLRDALDRAAGRIEARNKRYYLLSFCTSARKGEREVKIQARARNPEGSGSFSYTFNADGLGPPPECDPKTPAAFDRAGVDEKDKDRDRDKDEAKPAGKGQPKAKPGAGQKLIDTPPPDR